MRTHCAKGHEYTADNTIYTRDGARRCRACLNVVKRHWEHLHGKQSKWKSLYGLSEAGVYDMHRKQNGCCPICHRVIAVERRGQNPANVDHDHKTGLVRGLLCGLCNRAIGSLGDSPEAAERAALYLRGLHDASGDAR